MIQLIQLILVAVGGVAAMFFLDPDRGKRRRALARDRAIGMVHRAQEMSERLQRRVVSDAYGMSQRLTHPGALQEIPPNDAVLANKVMTELFRDRRIPKGSINVSAEQGIVQLRGQVDHPEQIVEIESRVRRIPGVADVEVLLHLPGTPAPTS
jgi:osmotically-inducible protein OsmY